MKIFIGQRVSNEYGKKLIDESMQVIDTLKKVGHDAYCTLCEDGNFQDTPRDWLYYAFSKIDKSNTFLAIVRSEQKSEGLLMEIGYVLSKKKKFILAINEKVKDTYLREMADEVIEWKNFEDLIKKLNKLK